MIPWIAFSFRPCRAGRQEAGRSTAGVLIAIQFTFEERGCG
jgi:hypothetical protein